MRLGAALAAQTAGLRTPLYRIMLSEGMTFGLPPRAYALTMYRALLDEFAPGAPRMLAGYLLDPLPLIPAVVAAGGHVRVGLEDAPFGSERSNAQWVQAAATAITNSGGGLATASEVRAALAAPARRDAALLDQSLRLLRGFTGCSEVTRSAWPRSPPGPPSRTVSD
jgi:uncharacterized protein (DUF849 family)